MPESYNFHEGKKCLLYINKTSLNIIVLKCKLHGVYVGQEKISSSFLLLHVYRHTDIHPYKHTQIHM